MVKLKNNTDLTEVIELFISMSEESKYQESLIKARSLSLIENVESKEKSLKLTNIVALELFEVHVVFAE